MRADVSAPPVAYAVLVADTPYVIHRTAYENGNPRLDLYSADERTRLLTLTRDLPKLKTRSVDADYAFKRTHALIAPNTGWVEALIDSHLIRPTGDAVVTQRGLYAYVAHLLFV